MKTSAVSWLALAVALPAVTSDSGAQRPQIVALGRPLATLAQPFSQVAAVREEPDGRVLVLDDIENRIVRVDLASGDIAAIGRVGQGPGEYTLPRSLLALAGDSTLAIDMSGGGRALLITGLGARTERLMPADVTDGAPLFTHTDDVQADARGRLYELVPTIAPGGRLSGTYGVRRLDRASGRQDTIGQLERVMRSPLARRPAGAPGGPPGARSAAAPPPFASVDQWAVAPDGRIAFATVEPYRVLILGPDGGRVEGPVLEYAPIPITAAIKAEWREREERPRPTLVYGPNGVSATHTRRPYQEPQAWPEALPPFLGKALRFSPTGMLWIERAVSARTGQAFDIIDGRGHLVWRVTLPERVRLVGFGRRGVYTVRRDEDDLEYLQLHPAVP